MKTKMNILNLATTDDGGAGMVCRKTNEVLLRKGFNSFLLVKESASHHEGSCVLRRIPKVGSVRYKLKEWGKKLNRIYRKFDPLEVDDNYSFYGLFERRRHYSARKILKKVPFTPDVIILYWISEFVNTATMKELADLTGAKFLWLMTDNAPITGGCHYPWECKGFQTDCSNCPGILTGSKKRIVRENLAFKKQNLPERIDLFAGSDSDFQRGSTSYLFRDKKVRMIFPPVDENKFKPGDKLAAQSYFGIPRGKKVIFYGASELKFLRKGGVQFLEALKKLNELMHLPEHGGINEFVLLIAGKDWHEYFNHDDMPIKGVGFLNEDGLVKAFQAADFFVSPSIEDSGPTMVIQSVMAGTPIVAFNTGVAMNLVKNGKTGYLARLSDVDDLLEGLKYMLTRSDEELAGMSQNCRNEALTNYTQEVFTNTLIESFK